MYTLPFNKVFRAVQVAKEMRKWFPKGAHSLKMNTRETPVKSHWETCYARMNRGVVIPLIMQLLLALFLYSALCPGVIDNQFPNGSTAFWADQHPLPAC